MHYYIYTVGRQLRDKTSDIGRFGIDPNKIPTFEVKALSKFLIYCSPNIQKSGYVLMPLGTFTPVALSDNQIDEQQEHFDSICKKYGLISNSTIELDGGSYRQIPTKRLFKEGCKIYKGSNRHLGVLRIMDSLLRRNSGILSLEQIEQLAREWNNKHCEPPLDDIDFNRQWNDAQKYITEKIQEDSNGNGNARKGEAKASKLKNADDADGSCKFSCSSALSVDCASTGLTIATEGEVANSSAIPIVIPLRSRFITSSVIRVKYKNLPLHL